VDSPDDVLQRNDMVASLVSNPATVSTDTAVSLVNTQSRLIASPIRRFYRFLGLSAGLHKKLRADLAEIFRKVRLGQT